MCVTNFVKRAPKPVTVNVSVNPSMISQRLASTFVPLMTSSSSAKPVAAPRPNIPATIGGYSAPAEDSKNKPKRRRKPCKPGLTAKKNERHFVKHDYHDHAFDTDESDVDDEAAAYRGKPRKPCSTAQTFPMKLHSLLERVEADGHSHIISWQPHGRCFLIHNPKEFADVVLPTYLRQGKLTSFQRQLNLYGFVRLTRGKDAGGYYHELFLRSKNSLVKRMKRTKIKGTKFKAASSPDQEPDFYSMPPVAAAAQVSDESSSDNDSHSHKMDQSVSMQTQSCGMSMRYNSSTTFDPIPLQVPCSQVFHPPMQAFNMFPVATNGNVATASPTLSGVTSAPVSSTSNWGDTGNVSMMAFSGITSSGLIPGNFTSAPAVAAPTSAADSILDDAVDELFNTGPIPESIGNLDDLWDSDGFGETKEAGIIENDLQLGNLLESFLEQG
ncbi:MAG: hypothetical protein SGILL_005278 [Bacillariaceae sp.]